MRSLRFLVSRRWLLFLAVVLLLAYACLLLGRWQWHRLEHKKTDNTIIRTNESAAPAPVEQVLREGQNPDSTQQYAVVSATGTYDVAKTVIIRYQTDDHGASGVDVVVPLVTESGTALLVDRGWVATSNQGLTDPSQVPAPPSGRVTVTGSVRRDADGSSAQVVDGSARAISSAQIQPAIGIPVYGGFVDLKTESPAAGHASGVRRPARPQQRAALLLRPAVVVLRPARAVRLRLPRVGGGDRAGRPAPRPAAGEEAEADEPRLGSGPASQGAEHASVDREHHAGQEGRGGAEQERRGTAEL